jgi:hypothetical protein
LVLEGLLAGVRLLVVRRRLVSIFFRVALGVLRGLGMGGRPVLGLVGWLGVGNGGVVLRLVWGLVEGRRVGE